MGDCTKTTLMVERSLGRKLLKINKKTNFLLIIAGTILILLFIQAISFVTFIACQ